MQLRTDGAHCLESAGTGPAVVLKVVRVTGVLPACLCGYHHEPILVHLPLSAWRECSEREYRRRECSKRLQVFYVTTINNKRHTARGKESYTIINTSVQLQGQPGSQAASYNLLWVWWMKLSRKRHEAVSIAIITLADPWSRRSAAAREGVYFDGGG